MNGQAGEPRIPGGSRSPSRAAEPQVRRPGVSVGAARDVLEGDLAAASFIPRPRKIFSPQKMWSQFNTRLLNMSKL